jgi:hypothetical protein
MTSPVVNNEPFNAHSISTLDIQNSPATKDQLAELLSGLKVPTAVNFSPVDKASEAASNSMTEIAAIDPTMSMKADTPDSVRQNAAKALNFVNAREGLATAIKELGSALKPIADYQKVIPGDAGKITAGHKAVFSAMQKFTESIAAAQEAGLLTQEKKTEITPKLASVGDLVQLAKDLETVVAPPTEQKIDYSSVPNLTFTSLVGLDPSAGWEFIERERNKKDILTKCKWEGELEGKLERTGVLGYINREFNEALSLTNEGLKDPTESTETQGKRTELAQKTDELTKFPTSFGDYLTKDGLLTGLWRGVQTIGSFGILGYSTVANERSVVEAEVKLLIAETQTLESVAAEANSKVATERANAIESSMRSVKQGLSNDLEGMKWRMDNTKPEKDVDRAEVFLREVSIPAERRITHVEDLIEDLKTRGFVAEGEAIKLKKDDQTLSFTRRTDGSVYMELNGVKQNGFLWTDKVEAVVAAFEKDPKSVDMEKEPAQQPMVVQAVEKRVAA